MYTIEWRGKEIDSSFLVPLPLKQGPSRDTVSCRSRVHSGVRAAIHFDCDVVRARHQPEQALVADFLEALGIEARAAQQTARKTSAYRLRKQGPAAVSGPVVWYTALDHHGSTAGARQPESSQPW